MQWNGKLHLKTSQCIELPDEDEVQGVPSINLKE